MQTLSELLRRNVARAPQAGAVTDPTGTCSWQAFASLVEGYAALLAQNGVAVGDRVALWLPNSIDYLALIFGVARLGALSVHVNTRFGASEVASLLTRSKAKALVTEWGFPPIDFPKVFGAIAPEARTTLQCIVGRHARARDLGGLPVVSLIAGGTVVDVATADAACLTFTTSGTTRGPKLVLHNQRAIASHADNVASAFGMDAPETCVFVAVPLCGTFGHTLALGGIAGGAHIVLTDRFEPSDADRLLRKCEVTHTAGGDDMLGRIADAAGGRAFDTLAFTGFARFTPSAAASIAAAEALRMRPRGLYGSSEVQALFSRAPDDDPLMDGGVPVSPLVELAIRDPETGIAVFHGDNGELCIKAPSAFVGYLDDPDATARAGTADGFFRAGDLAHLQSPAFVFKSRIGDSLRLGGFLVNPEEIESFLHNVPGVAEAQVVAVEIDGTRRAFAFVRRAAGSDIDEAAVLKACVSLARYKQPVRVAFLHAFPVTDGPNGVKIQRAKLRDMAAQAMMEPRLAT